MLLITTRKMTHIQLNGSHLIKNKMNYILFTFYSKWLRLYTAKKNITESIVKTNLLKTEKYVTYIINIKIIYI